MKSVKLQIMISFLVLVNLVLPVTAIAYPVTYSHSGGYFGDIRIGYLTALGSYDEEDKIDITLTTIDGYLPPSESIDPLSTTYYDLIPYLQSWTFYDGIHEINNSNTEEIRLRAIVQEGDILFWLMDASSSFVIDDVTYSQGISSDREPYIGYEQEWATISTPVDESSDDEFAGRIYAEYFEDTALGNGWTMSCQSVPEPASAILLFSAFIGIFVYMRKLAIN